VQKHAREVHPEMKITREQALTMVQPDGDERYASRHLLIGPVSPEAGTRQHPGWHPPA